MVQPNSTGLMAKSQSISLMKSRWLPEEWESERLIPECAHLPLKNSKCFSPKESAQATEGPWHRWAQLSVSCDVLSPQDLPYWILWNKRSSSFGSSSSRLLKEQKGAPRSTHSPVQVLSLARLLGRREMRGGCVGPSPREQREVIYEIKCEREMTSSCHGAPSTEEPLSRDLRN